jgi:hypothetical protein
MAGSPSAPIEYSTLATLNASGQSFTFISDGTATGWSLLAVDTHTHAASAITIGILDFDRIQQVLEVEIDGTEGTPTEVDLTTNIVGGNLHALVVLLGASATTATKVILPALGAAATGKVTVRVNEFEDPSDDFVQIVLDDDTAIFPASGYTEMDPGEEFTFRWNNGRWDMDLRPNPFATTAVSIFKPNASGTLALTSSLTDTQIFTANGTWTKPAGAKNVHYTVIGGGGGGGSGRIGATGTDRGGGGGGSGAGITLGWINPSALGATETITVGSGGAGGASNTASTDADGNAGSAGGNSSIGTVAIGFAGNGGQGGVGSGTANGGAGTGDRSIIYGTLTALGAGGPSPATSAATSVPRVSAAPTGGGGGGRITSGNAAGGGAASGPMGSSILGQVPATAGTAAGAGAGLSGATAYNFAGIGGAGASSTSVGAKGGNGGDYGGGGGGGSAAANGASGDNSGGKGGNGLVIVTTYF